MSFLSNLPKIPAPKRTITILVLLSGFAMTSSYVFATILFFLTSFILASIVLENAWVLKKNKPQLTPPCTPLTPSHPQTTFILHAKARQTRQLEQKLRCKNTSERPCRVSKFTQKP